MPESLEFNKAINDLIEEIWELEGFDRLHGRLEPEIKEITAIRANQTMERLARRLFAFRIHAEK